MTDSFVTEFRLRRTETVPVTEISAGDWIIASNSAGVKFYRLVTKRERAVVTFHQWRFIGAQDKDRPGFADDLATIPTGGDSYSYLYSSTVERVTDMGDVHPIYSLWLARGESGKLDRLIDGRSVWQVAKQVDKGNNLLIRFAGTDEFVPVPLDTIALLDPASA
jgi:hypothetical protein